jgi:hypothetical protein
MVTEIRNRSTARFFGINISMKVFSFPQGKTFLNYFKTLFNGVF